METTTAVPSDSELTVYLRRDAAISTHWLNSHGSVLFRLSPGLHSFWRDKYSRYYSVLMAEQTFQFYIDIVEDGMSLAPCAPWIDGPVPWTFLDEWRDEAVRSRLYELPRPWVIGTAAAGLAVVAGALAGLSWPVLATGALAVAALGRVTWVRRRYLCGPAAHGLAAAA